MGYLQCPKARQTKKPPAEAEFLLQEPNRGWAHPRPGDALAEATDNEKAGACRRRSWCLPTRGTSPAQTKIRARLQ